MGHPKSQRKKYSKPTHPWEKDRIVAEKEILNDYGLKRKYEIWKMQSVLNNFTRQAKNLIAGSGAQIDKEKNQLLRKLSSLSLIGKSAKIEDVLSLTLRNIMDRRLQTLVYKKNMSRSVQQARQFIVHEHIIVGQKKITVPSYLVAAEEEPLIQFASGSKLLNPEHPERIVKEAKIRKVAREKRETKKEKKAKGEEKAKKDKEIKEKQKEAKKKAGEIKESGEESKKKNGKKGGGKSKS